VLISLAIRNNFGPSRSEIKAQPCRHEQSVCDTIQHTNTKQSSGSTGIRSRCSMHIILYVPVHKQANLLARLVTGTIPRYQVRNVPSVIGVTMPMMPSHGFGRSPKNLLKTDLNPPDAERSVGFEAGRNREAGF
jgi:hypothetical protein